MSLLFHRQQSPAVNRVTFDSSRCLVKACASQRGRNPNIWVQLPLTSRLCPSAMATRPLRPTETRVEITLLGSSLARIAG